MGGAAEGGGKAIGEKGAGGGREGRIDVGEFVDSVGVQGVRVMGRGGEGGVRKEGGEGVRWGGGRDMGVGEERPSKPSTAQERGYNALSIPQSGKIL